MSKEYTLKKEDQVPIKNILGCSTLLKVAGEVVYLKSKPAYYCMYNIRNTLNTGVQCAATFSRIREAYTFNIMLGSDSFYSSIKLSQSI